MITNALSMVVAATLAGFNPDFNPAAHFAVDGYALVAGDVNGDGRPDFAVHNPFTWDDPSQSFGVLTVYLNGGNGAFSSYTCSVPTYNGVYYDLTAADFDGDGCCDLAIANSYSCRILRSNGAAGGFTSWALLGFNLPYTSFYQLTQMAVGDFDGDGRTDVFISGWETNGDYPYAFETLFLNRGDAVFDNPIFYWGPGADLWPLGAADMDGDGVAEWIDNYSNYHFWKYSPVQINLLGTAPSGSGGDFVAADFNGDGFVDLITLSHLTFGAGGATFAAPLPIDLGLDGPMRGFATADFNGDGLPDLAYLTQSGVTIADNDGQWPPSTAFPLVSINDVDVVEGNSGSSNAVFTVRLSAASTSTVTVTYSFVDGSATAGSDYETTSGTLTFAPGETQKPIAVRIYGDLKYEVDEYFVVNLSAASNATIIDFQGEGVIRNDDVDNVPIVSISSVAKREGNKGNTKFAFQVALSTSSSQAATVSYRTSDGTATVANNDYAAANGTLTFSPGQTSKTITVTIKGDRAREPDEVFYVDLFGASSNATIGQSRGTGTIVNDD